MRIAILSRNPALYSTQSLYLAARRRGHQVRVIDHMLCDLFIGEKGLDIFYFGEKIVGVDAIIPRIGASATSYGAAIVRQFEMQDVFSVVSSETLLKCRDKRTCLQHLCAQGILIPDSVITNNAQELRSSIQKVGPAPVIIKLLNSTQGLGVVLGETENSAESIMEAFLQTGEKVILQEFIREVNGSDIRVFIIDNKIIATMERVAPPGEFRSNLHRGAAARQIYLNENECAVALKAAQVMGLQVAGVDLLRSQKGPMILEVNASPGLEGIEGTSGKDVASKIIQFIERNAG
ncbi:MAG TPA: RimK family alpha-L-glutamate ligase [Saprospiraceae bacterium]|nr:RimK family alpha-L-glutamate ligase [Saprospiraceae bacterium]